MLAGEDEKCILVMRLNQLRPNKGDWGMLCH